MVLILTPIVCYNCDHKYLFSKYVIDARTYNSVKWSFWLSTTINCTTYVNIQVNLYSKFHLTLFFLRMICFENTIYFLNSVWSCLDILIWCSPWKIPFVWIPQSHILSKWAIKTEKSHTASKQWKRKNIFHKNGNIFRFVVNPLLIFQIQFKE